MLVRPLASFSHFFYIHGLFTGGFFVNMCILGHMDTDVKRQFLMILQAGRAQINPQQKKSYIFVHKK